VQGGARALGRIRKKDKALSLCAVALNCEQGADCTPLQKAWRLLRCPVSWCICTIAAVSFGAHQTMKCNKLPAVLLLLLQKCGFLAALCNQSVSQPTVQHFVLSDIQLQAQIYSC
jgi:hypothetical protein